MNEQDVQIIEKDGEPEYAVVPIEAHRRMVAALEDAADAAAIERAWAEDAAGDLAAQVLALRLDNKRMHSVGLAEALQGLRKPVCLRFGGPIFATAVRSIAEQLNECLSVNPDISLNLGHKSPP